MARPTFRVLAMASTKAILFMGDRPRLSPSLERFAKPESVAAIVAGRLRGLATELSVVSAPRYSWGTMACYDGFIHSLSPLGSPVSYNPVGLPAAAATLAALRSNKVVNVRIPDGGRGSDMCHAQEHKEDHKERIIVLGFSKGGIVLNQLMAELAYITSSIQDYDKGDGNNDPRPTSASSGGAEMSFLRSIDEMHYLDVGLNDTGAYQTDPEVLKGVAAAAAGRCMGLKVFMHGTPRQWMDPARPWIAAEKDLCLSLLKQLAHEKLQVQEKLYFGDEDRSLEMHFQILETFDP